MGQHLPDGIKVEFLDLPLCLGYHGNRVENADLDYFDQGYYVPSILSNFVQKSWRYKQLKFDLKNPRFTLTGMSIKVAAI